jgi:hypothetical protein
MPTITVTGWRRAKMIGFIGAPPPGRRGPLPSGGPPLLS